VILSWQLDETEVHMAIHESASDAFNTNERLSGKRQRGVATLIKAVDSVIARLAQRIANARGPNVDLKAAKRSCDVQAKEAAFAKTERTLLMQRSGGVSTGATKRRLSTVKRDLRSLHKRFLSRSTRDSRAASSLIRLCNTIIHSLRRFVLIISY
jgi:hypothetical protein